MIKMSREDHAKITGSTGEHSVVDCGGMHVVDFGGMHACRWYEHAWRLLGKQNSLSAYGSVYVLNQKTIADVIVSNFETLRFLANEGAT